MLCEQTFLSGVGTNMPYPFQSNSGYERLDLHTENSRRLENIRALFSAVRVWTQYFWATTEMTASRSC